MNNTFSNMNQKSPMEFRQLFTPISYTLQLYLMPVFLSVGIIGNPISFFCWISKKVRRNNSSAVYMAMLAINDFFVNILTIIYYLRTTWGLDLLDFPGICKIYNVIYIFFQYNSLPLVFGFTLERWIAVCYPFKRERCCTENRAWLACVLIFSVVFITSLPNGLLWYYKPNCHFLEEWRSNMFIVVYQLTLEFVISALIPILTLVLNIRVITEIYRIAVSEMNLSNPTPTTNYLEIPKEKRKRQNKNIQNSENNMSFKSTTTTLLLVSFFHILTTLPLGAVYIAQNFIIEGNHTLSDVQMKLDPIWNSHFKLHVAKDTIDMLSLSHYCFNIVIYLGSSQQFRSRILLFIKIHFTKQAPMNNSINNSYYKLRHSQETNKTEMSIRRNLKDSIKKEYS